MFDTQVARTDEGFIARSAVWLTCPDCGHTGRVLAVMASRVLQERNECSECLSTRVPRLRQTQVGAHIPFFEARHASLHEDEQGYVQAWIEDEGKKSHLRHWLRVLVSRLADRFSRAKTGEAQPSSNESAQGDEFGLTQPKNDVL